MFVLFLALLSRDVAQAARNGTGIVKTVLAKTAVSQNRTQMHFLPPADGLHPKHVVFPGSPAGTFPTHYSFQEPEGSILPQQLSPNTGPSTPILGNTMSSTGKSATGLNGVFLLLHACQYTSDDWFALPEEVYMVHELLSRGFLVVAPDAILQPAGCWFPDSDTGPLMHSFGLFRRAFGLEHLPLYAVGASSGGVMLSSLVAHGMSFVGTMFIVSPGGARHAWPGTFAKQNHPRTAFVLMPPDIFGVKEDIMGAVEALKHNGVPVVTFEVKPKPIHSLIARAEAMRIDKNVMRLMVDEISNLGFGQQQSMSGPTGSLYLRPTYAQGAYLTLVRHFSLTPVQGKALWEELRVIEGTHSPTAEYFSESIDFLLTGRYSTKKLLPEKTSMKSGGVTGNKNVTLSSSNMTKGHRLFLQQRVDSAARLQP